MAASKRERQLRRQRQFAELRAERNGTHNDAPVVEASPPRAWWRRSVEAGITAGMFAVGAVAAPLLVGDTLTDRAVTGACAAATVLTAVAWGRLRRRLGGATTAVAIAVVWGALFALVATLDGNAQAAATWFQVGMLLVVSVAMLAAPLFYGGRFAKFAHRTVLRVRSWHASRS